MYPGVTPRPNLEVSFCAVAELVLIPASCRRSEPVSDLVAGGSYTAGSSPTGWGDGADRHGGDWRGPLGEAGGRRHLMAVPSKQQTAVGEGVCAADGGGGAAAKGIVTSRRHRHHWHAWSVLFLAAFVCRADPVLYILAVAAAQGLASRY
jgi:hypothetical protein